MRKKILFIWLPLLLLSAPDAGAQSWYMRRYELDMNLGVVAFYGDIGEKEKPLANLFNGFRPSMGITPRFLLSQKVALSLDLNYLVYAGHDDEGGAHGRVYAFNSHAFQHFVRMEYLLVGSGGDDSNPDFSNRGMVRPASFFQLYVLAGAGGILSVAKVKDRLNDDREPLDNPGYYPGVHYAAGFPLGGGIRVNPGQLWGLGVEATYNLVLSDRLDGYESAYSDANDSYYLLEFKAVLRIRNDRQLRPHFRKYYEKD